MRQPRVDSALRTGSVVALAVRALFHVSHVELTLEPGPGTARADEYIALGRPGGARICDQIAMRTRAAIGFRTSFGTSRDVVARSRYVGSRLSVEKSPRLAGI
jgi:hypothetical protein